MEEFIERSNALLAARPETARISTRYTHKHAAASGERVDPSAKPAKVVVKAYDPVSGIVYKYKAKKANELSRILASLSPQTFEFGSGRKRGISSIMCDVEPKEEPAPAATPAASKSSATTKSATASEVSATAETAGPSAASEEVKEVKPKSKKKKSKKH